ncbi:MAG: hypothetical protein K0Q59_1289 [Paenibacillus sp.]|jgi:hypothetical protein|nr:hypothetical protein [Paenibacillus sp.]
MQKRSGDSPNRELTYRDGWRKGKVAGGKSGLAASKANIASAKPQLALGPGRQLLERYVWRRTPFVPVGGLTLLLLAFPAISFGLTWWLVYQLSNR